MIYNSAAIREAYDKIVEREDSFEKEHFLRNEIPREFIKRYLRATDVVLDAGGGSGHPSQRHNQANQCERSKG